MPKIPTPTRTISQIVEAQVPDFVREDYPKFVAFLKAYYEWLESNGTEVYSCKLVNSSNLTVTVTDTASPETNAYAGLTLVVLNGPAKGHARKIKSYDPATRIITLVNTWAVDNVPPPNSKIAIRDAIYPDKLLTYRDIDTTLDQFIEFFRTEFLYQIPGNVLADKRNILKHVKEFYQGRGTENSFRFLFRVMFNQEVEFYYPKVDLFRLSDARWTVENIMRTTTNGDTFDYVNRQVVGVSSGATAKVESVTHSIVSGQNISEFKLSNIDGKFDIDPATSLPEKVKIVYPFTPPPQTNLGAPSDLLEPGQILKWEDTYQILQKLLVAHPGDDYSIGDEILITDGGALSPAKAIVTAIFQKYYNGRCSPPPTSYYLEPYFGPDDVVNPTGDPLQDGVCIPGLYFFSDVHSDFDANDIITDSQIILAATEVSEDDFFVGDEIALTSGTGAGQRRIVVSYNGLTKVAAVDQPYDPMPDGSTMYSILHNRGGIKAVKIVDFGLGFVSTPTITIITATGSGAQLPPFLGLVGQTAGDWTVGRDGGVGSAPTTTDSFASSNKIIQDSFYWQDFSYDLRFNETINKYRDVVKSLLHPAGFKMFGSVLLNTQPKTNFFQIIKTLTLNLEAKLFQEKLVVDNTTVIEISDGSKVIGAKNKDLDWMKFFAFPPNTTSTLRYPFPNANYFLPNGPGNTQINNLKDVVIGNIINFPERRTKINADAYIKIDNLTQVPRVGPVGQSRAAIARSRFTGFPPYEGFYDPYPAPNQNFWNGFGETQIGALKDIVLSDLIVHPETKHSNFCVDVDLQIYRNEAIPVQGDICEYAFIPGMDTQTVYNVAPLNFGRYEAALGFNVLPGGDDPLWTAQGLAFSRASQQFVNASGIPIDMRQGTVVVVCKTNDIVTDASILNCIPDAITNGFSIEVRQDGAVSFRVQYNGSSKVISFPVSTISAGTYFLAALRFDHGLLQGNVNHQRKAAQFRGFPSAPAPNVGGWHFAKASTQYVPMSFTASLYGSTLDGQNRFRQAAAIGTPVTVDYFDGSIAYALFYDRAIYDFELDFIYTQLQAMLTPRGITLL